MHNCRLTRNSLIELALDDLSPAGSAELLAALKDCRECQEEFATIKSALRTSGQALQAALPAEDFWPGYHARLQTALAELEVSDHATLRSRPASRVSAWLGLRRLMTTSVRVPAPVAAAAVLLFGAMVFFAINSRGAATPESLTPTSDAAPPPTRVVEVPVIREKVVTRVVYVETSRGRNADYPNNRLNNGRGNTDDVDAGDINQAAEIDVASGVARVRPDPRSAAMSLAGFKPTDEVKLTIIKGSDPK